MSRSRDRTPETPSRSRGARRPRSGGGEFGLITEIRRTVASHGRGRGVVFGIGDDAAVVRTASRPSRNSNGTFVLTTDAMVEGVHFRRGWLTPAELGVRAYRAAVSDIAAMGARPLWVLLALELPAGRRRVPDADVVKSIRAFSAEARKTGAALVGGNVTRGPGIALTTTIIGESPSKPPLRGGAKPGDAVFVTGRLGGAAAERRMLAHSRNGRAQGSRASAGSGYRVPPLRIAFAADAARLATAMIDVSDGLLQDAGHLADESGVTIRLDRAAIPIARGGETGGRALALALTGGEDYELVFTASPRRAAAVAKLAAKHRVAVTRIGTVERGAARVIREDGEPFDVASAGFDHLRVRGKAAR